MNFLFQLLPRSLTRDLVTKQYIVYANIIPDAGLNDGMTIGIKMSFYLSNSSQESELCF